MIIRYYCRGCGSENVYADAWVGLNDPTDVLGPYDTFYCMGCGDQDASIDEIEVEEAE